MMENSEVYLLLIEKLPYFVYTGDERAAPFLLLFFVLSESCRVSYLRLSWELLRKLSLKFG